MEPKRNKPKLMVSVMGSFALLVLNLSFLSSSTLTDGFGFAGLSLKTTVGELKKRYPKSPMVANYMYLSEIESHDHIYGIEIPANPGGRLGLVFERPQSLGSPHNGRYPACQQIVSVIQSRYGLPTRVEEFAEEKSLNRRFSWTRQGEILSLHCFRVNSTNFQAEALTISESAP